MDRPLRVLALVPYALDTAPSQRFRLEQWAPYLLEQGIQIDFLPFSSPELSRLLYARGRTAAKIAETSRGLARRWLHARGAAAYDLALVHREACPVGPAWVERLLRLHGVPFVYDFDDAVWLPNVSPSNRGVGFLKMPGKTATICRLATSVVAGNRYLADYAARHNARVDVVPTTVSLRRYRPSDKNRGAAGPPVVGWSGSHSSAPYLALVKRALSQLHTRVPFRLLVIGAEGVGVPEVDVECRPWRSDSEVEDLAPIDVGLMPMPDDPWARGKCALKAIQYMGLGIPAVVSPVGANAEVVTHGHDGFHATTEAEWIHALGSLLEDPTLRARMGAEARATVERRFSAEVHAPRVAAILRDAAESGARRPTTAA